MHLLLIWTLKRFGTIDRTHLQSLNMDRLSNLAAKLTDFVSHLDYMRGRFVVIYLLKPTSIKSPHMNIAITALDKSH